MMNTHCTLQQKGIEIWARPIMPVSKGRYSYAIVFLNRRTDGTPSEVSVTLKELGLDHREGYHITDLYDDYDYGIVTPERRFKVDVNPSGSVVMIRCDLYSKAKHHNNINNNNNNNFVEPGRDAQPRKADTGFVLDHGNVGYIPNVDGQHPQGGRYPAAASTNTPPKSLHGYLYQQQRQHPYIPTTFAPSSVSPAAAAAHEHGYGFQRIHASVRSLNG